MLRYSCTQESEFPSWNALLKSDFQLGKPEDPRQPQLDDNIIIKDGSAMHQQ
ncbi:Hypothetical predicted protein [Xyrichtys novacula]|uniref:Uncharacterized protein n=1 Tax=Xyrichtys novacula TaxID=13765 RepID=A0AAV1GA16_XYRNO|nr:Hypothetical predicted protein [Xyrichtys novacula]